jgi:hypothetical protein
VHGTTGEIPWERLDDERGYLRPLPENLSLPFVIENRQATRTSLISVEGNQYSVPSRWARQRKTPTNPLQAKFEGLAPEAAAYLQGLSRSRVGFLRNQMEKIIALAADYSPAAVSRAMRRALEYGAFSYGSLKGILKRYAIAPESLPEMAAETNPLSADLDVRVEKRDLSYYGALGAAT